jgi:hypothetical protein
MDRVVEAMTPQRENPPPFDSHPAVVKRWLEHLPRAHTGELARQLYHALASVNRQEISVKRRFQFLEAINAPLNDVLDSLPSHYAGKPLPLSGKRQKVADLYYQLLKQTIIGYQKVIASSLELGRFGWKQTVSTAIHRIFGFQRLLLGNARLLYHPYPKGLWQQIYWLYSQVEHHGLLGSKVAIAGDPAHKTSLATEFNKLLLHALLTPNLFQLKELEAVLATMEHWTRHVRVVALRRPEQSHVYAFKLQTDMPPGLMPDNESEDEAAAFDDVRYLLMDDLVKHLDKLAQQAEPGISEIRIARRLTLPRRALLLLTNTWGRPTTRRSPRKPVNAKVEIAIGMSAIHYITSSGRRNAPTPGAHPPPPQGNEVEDIFVPLPGDADTKPSLEDATFVGQREQSQDIWETAYFEPEPAPPSWTESIQLKAYSYQKAAVQNTSSGGLCITLEQNAVEQIQLNEWVAMRNREGPWTLGMIRWLLCPTRGPIRAGIERLSAQLQPALLHLQTDNPHSQPIRCLLGNNGQSPMLYLPKLPTRLEGRLLDLEANGHRDSITLHDQVFTTPTGSAYQIERHRPQQTGTAGRTRETGGAADRYAAIWGKL